MPAGKPSEGRPALKVRLEPEVIEALRQRAEELWPHQNGRGGGAAHLLRVLAYRELGLPEPELYQPAESPRNRKKVAALRAAGERKRGRPRKG